jgi:hypothetical protein
MIKLKLGLLAGIIVVIVGAIGSATISTSSADPSPPPPPCARKVFKTKMIKAACTGTRVKPGGQADAKAAMQKFAADHSIKCAKCHTTFSPDYKIKDTAFKHYQELGGK